MANYIAIIELHGAENEEDFQHLDAAMKERQFFPQIRDDDGEAYLTAHWQLRNSEHGHGAEGRP